MSKSNQGRWAEGKVRDWLNAYKLSHSAFTFNRILDATSAMGAMSNPQPGDFQWFKHTGLYHWHEGVQHEVTRNGLIEVKSVLHAHRLPYNNFGVDQVARMRLRALAGSEPLVLVAFRPEGQKPYWRTAPLEFFEQRNPQTPSGSWDFSGVDAYSHCDDLLEMALK